LLAAITSVPGVSVAVVMDRGGFVIDRAGEMELDAGDVAAVASALLESCDGLSRDLGQGGIKSLICEFENGLVLVTGADLSTRLAVVIHDPSQMEAVRRSAARNESNQATISNT
jgi:predicted regulator of Ras-like GTPase activity (Roadblock/LC7/MglB family)